MLRSVSHLWSVLSLAFLLFLSLPEFSWAGFGAIFGLVIDGTTGKGIGGALVQVNIHTETLPSQSLPDGGYTSHLPDGDGYVMTVSYPGYITFRKDHITLPDNGLVKIDVILTREWATIAGPVIDGYTLKKLSSVDVYLLLQTPPASGGSVAWSRSDSSGNYSIYRSPLWPRDYVLNVHRPGYYEYKKAISVNNTEVLTQTIMIWPTSLSQQQILIIEAGRAKSRITTTRSVQEESSGQAPIPGDVSTIEKESEPEVRQLAEEQRQKAISEALSEEDLQAILKTHEPKMLDRVKELRGR